jgi:hypothetical protein
MPRITTQREFAESKQPSFCYLCGEPLDNGDPTNEDHCPPKSIFGISDRSDYPIVLKVHEDCNHQWCLSDDMLVLFFDPLSGQGKVGKERHRSRMEKRKVSVGFEGRVIDGYTNLPLRPFAARVVRCMHAVLYKEWLPPGVAEGHIMFPFAEANRQGELVSAQQSKVSLAMARTIASSVKADTFDYVIAYNRKFKYVCCWSSDECGMPICLWAFDILNMSQMAEPFPGLPKAVIGHYAVSLPRGSHSKATVLSMPLTTGEAEYPFPE